MEERDDLKSYKFVVRLLFGKSEKRCRLLSNMYEMKRRFYVLIIWLLHNFFFHNATYFNVLGYLLAERVKYMWDDDDEERWHFTQQSDGYMKTFANNRLCKTSIICSEPCERCKQQVDAVWRQTTVIYTHHAMGNGSKKCLWHLSSMLRRWIWNLCLIDYV